MREGVRPIGSEITVFSKNPEALSEFPERESVPIPNNVQEALAMHKQTIEHEMVNDFGMPEIPKEILSEMEFVAKAIEQKGKERSFQQEVDESVLDQLRILAVRISQFKHTPTQIRFWRLGLMTLASAPIALAISRRSERRLGPIIEQTYETEAATAQEIEEQISAHQDIVLSGMREVMADRLQELSRAQNRQSFERHRARADMQFQAQGVLSPAIISGLTVGGVALRELGIQEAGKIVTALVYSGMFRSNLDQVIYANNGLLESLRGVREMEEVFNGYAKEETERDEGRVGASELTEFSIDVRDVSLEIDGNTIIDHVSFHIPAGGVVRLEGQSGQGKTTMTRLMSGYYDSTSGEVRIGNYPADQIKKTGLDSLYGHMAYLSQHPYIFETGNLKDNLSFGNVGVTDAQMEEVLGELGLSARFSKKGKIDLTSKMQGLSGGERARLGLARVLLKIRSQENGSVVFLDQPTEELDAKTETEVAKILFAEKRKHPKTTFVIISHSEDFIRQLEQPSDGGSGIDIKRVRFEKGKVL